MSLIIYLLVLFIIAKLYISTPFPYTGNALIYINSWSEIDVNYQTDGKFWYGREYDYANYIIPDPSTLMKLRVFGTGNLGTIKDYDYGTINAPVDTDIDTLAALVYIPAVNMLFYHSYQSDILYYTTAQPDINSLTFTWLSFNVPESTGLNILTGLPWSLSNSRYDILIFSYDTRYVYTISPLTFKATGSFRISPFGTISQPESLEMLHTFGYDGTYYYFGGSNVRSGNGISVYRSSVSYDPNTTPVQENFVQTYTGSQVDFLNFIFIFLRHPNHSTITGH